MTMIKVSAFLLVLLGACSETAPQFHDSNFASARCVATAGAIDPPPAEKSVPPGKITGHAHGDLIKGYWISWSFDRDGKVFADINYRVAANDVTDVVGKLSGHPFLLRKVGTDGEITPLGVYSPGEDVNVRALGLAKGELLEVSYPTSKTVMPPGTYDDRTASLPFDFELGRTSVSSKWRFSGYTCTSCDTSFAVTVTRASGLGSENLVDGFECNAVLTSKPETGGPLGSY